MPNLFGTEAGTNEVDGRPENVLKKMQEVLDTMLTKTASNIRYGSDVRPVSQYRLTLTSTDLTTARTSANPLRVNVPFTSYIVEAATDTNTNVYLAPSSDSIVSLSNYKLIKLNDSAEYSRTQNDCFLYWPAQSGATMTIVFFVDVAFRPGSQISVTAGGVSITEGSAFSNSVITLAAATAGILCPSSTSRKVASFENETGADMWLGSSSVTNTGSTKGQVLHPGGRFSWKNSAPLYGYSVAGGDVVVMEET